MTSQEPVAPSYRDRVVSHLSAAGLVLAACTGLLLMLALSGRDRAVSGTWPEGTPVKSSEALRLSDSEAALFDASVFGSYGRSAALSLAAPHLPAMVPLQDESLWQSARGTELRQEARSALGLLQECTRGSVCNASMMDERGREAARLLGTRGNSASICDSSPREAEGDKRVPLGLLAAALSWIADCRAHAAVLLENFEQRAATSRLAVSQRDMAALYARFNRAKLELDSGSSSNQQYLAELRAIRTKILKSDLAASYKTLAELERWGLSMAEIRAEWMLAEARAAASASRGKALDEKIAALQLFEPVPAARVLQGDGVSAGEARLRAAWCAMALRFEFVNEASEAALPACIVALATEATFPAELRCAFGARDAIVAGDWQPDALRYCESSTGTRDNAAKLLERVASRTQTWRAALARYATLPAGPERRALFAYLDTYAVRTDNRVIWFRHEQPGLFALAVIAALTVAVGWAWWIWAVMWRRRSLWRFLPPQLAADR